MLASVPAAQVHELLSLVADINSAPMGSNPGSLIVFNNELYFGANDGIHGIEIWKYNGTSVSRVTDINPGANSSSFSQPCIFNGVLYFRATDGTNGIELWKYDGVNATVVTNINPGSASSGPNFLRVFNGALYFSATDGVFGNEVWKYDGTTASRVTDINPGSASANPSELTVFNNALYFSASNSTYGVELWKYDGVSASLAANINPGSASSKPQSLTVFNGALYFGATDSAAAGGHGRVLWKYDGTNATLALDTISSNGASDPINMAVFNGALYYSATDFLGTELYGYDGSNVTRLADYVAGGKFVYNGALYFDEGFTDDELYKYDGTNVSLVANIYPGPTGSFPSSFAVYNGVMYFRATDAIAGSELWRYDGASVSRVADINTGSGGSSPSDGVVFRNALYFNASTNGSTAQFWKFDGTNTVMVTNGPAVSDIPAVFNDQLYLSVGTTLRKYDGTNFTTVASGLFDFAYNLTVYNGALYFRARNSTVGDELWKYDGTNATPVTNINPGSADATPEDLTVFNGALYFAATDGTGVGLWKYNGVAASRVGTLVLPNFVPISNTVSLAVSKGVLYLSASSNGTEFEPWKYDGTNFTQIADIMPGSGSSYPVFWSEYRGAVIFSAYDANGIGQLWKYDGAAVTRITDAASAGGFYAYPLYDALYYVSTSAATGFELFKYDGTTNSLVADLNPGVANSLPLLAGSYNNTLFYNATDGYHGTELWRLDPLDLAFRVTNVAREGNDLRVTWTSVGGRSNILQVATAGPSGYTTNGFTDLGSMIVPTNTAIITTNYLDIGGATNKPARYYRVRLVP